MSKIINFKNLYIKQIIISIILITIAIIIYRFLKKIIKKITLRNTNLSENNTKKIQTVNMLIINIVKYALVIIVIMMILGIFGVNINSLIAGLGVTTAIIGLAFQDMAKDLIAGIFIITEDQYEVGDTIEVDGFIGEVISVGLKTTKIRNYKGATKIIGNHYMDNVINYSIGNSLAVVDVGVDYDEKSEKIEKVLNDLKENLKDKIPNAIGELNILGITKLGDSSIEYRVTIETKPMKQYEVERFLRREIKELFDKENIKIPFPQIEVHNGK